MISISWIKYQTSNQVKLVMKYSVIVFLEEPHKDFVQFILNLYNVFSGREESFEIIIIANGTGGKRNPRKHRSVDGRSG